MPTDRTERSLRATFLGIGVNIILAAGKLTGGILGQSHALIADAMESLADIVSSIIVWRAVLLAAEPPDWKHPYGHGKDAPSTAAPPRLSEETGVGTTTKRHGGVSDPSLELGSKLKAQRRSTPG